MTETTHIGLFIISTLSITNYTNIADLQVIIIKTLARWFPNNYDFNKNSKDEWLFNELDNNYTLHSNIFRIKLYITNENEYTLEMYAVGRFRRHGSSCAFYERVLEYLEYQINNPENDINDIMDAEYILQKEEDKLLDNNCLYSTNEDEE